MCVHGCVCECLFVCDPMCKSACMPMVCVHVCDFWMYVGQCMGASMTESQDICMRMHVCDDGWRVFYVYGCM